MTADEERAEGARRLADGYLAKKSLPEADRKALLDAEIKQRILELAQGLDPGWTYNLDGKTGELTVSGTIAVTRGLFYPVGNPDVATVVDAVSKELVVPDAGDAVPALEANP